MLRAFIGLVMLAGCGRVGFESAGDGGVTDDAPDGDDGSVTSVQCEPRPAMAAIDRVVGTGTSTSCTELALRAALEAGGTIGFDCGGGGTSFVLSQPLEITRDVTLVANEEVRFVGNNARILLVNAPGARVTLVDLFFTGGRAGPDMAGGAVLVDQGDLVVVGSTFTSNTAGEGGGAIFVPTQGRLAVYDSVFNSNTAGRGGAIEALGETLLVRSEFISNDATNIGGAVEASGGEPVRMCGVVMRSNTAQGLGGGLHRVVSSPDPKPTTIESSVFANNSGANGGGAYVQRTHAVVRATTFVTNFANNGIAGGYWQTEALGSFTGENLTVALNSSTAGTGAGMNIGAGGALSFSTIVGNSCLQPGCAGAGLKTEGGVSLHGVIIAGNQAPQNGNCSDAMLDGTASFQWPDDGSPLCAPQITRGNPTLTAEERTGPRGAFPVYTPAADSPVFSVATNCPALDQLGNPRTTPCSAGAVER